MDYLQKTVDELSPYDIKVMYTDYQTRFGYGFCQDCKSQVEAALIKLKAKDMNFKFKKNAAIYRIQKGSASVIHNGNITNELALEFLSIKPSRASLFSKVSDTWQHDISEFMEDVQDTPKVSQEPQDEPCEECEKRKELQAFKMNELRELYPDIPAPVGTKKVDLIDAILASESK